MYEALEQIALNEFGDIVHSAQHLGRRAETALKLRLNLRDETFVDIWLNLESRKYSYHWEQRAKRGLIHRHDNAPDHPEISTHPKHFHNGSESQVEESRIPDDPTEALRFFLEFVRAQLN